MTAETTAKALGGHRAGATWMAYRSMEEIEYRAEVHQG
ncbi:hypothetical protein ABIB75_007665 [Bradyrhizobium sp. GM2.2]